ncbi:MAG TPA: hypothetical protein PLE75_10515 [Ferruginibacter sp.]|nr:hypothetical protein [Ferruginibacter sp.]HRO07107.1 hypothetical protein [Ferruginibacter sp.]HRP49784.1 hypothetical protein [Ferruginibacter sp.]
MKCLLSVFFILIVFGMLSCSNENTPDATLNVPNSRLSFKINGQEFNYIYPDDFIVANLEFHFSEATVRITAHELAGLSPWRNFLNIQDLRYVPNGFWDLPPTRLYTSATTSLGVDGQVFNNDGLINSGYYTNVNITRIDSIAGYYAMGNTRITGTFSAKLRRTPSSGGLQDVLITDGHFNDVILVRD